MTWRPSDRDDADEFYILSLRWTREDYVTWWCPNNSGYTSIIDQAGRYTRAAVERNPGYYNNGETTLAIPCREVEACAARIVFDFNLRRLTTKRLARVIEGGDDECASCGNFSRATNLGLRVVGDDDAQRERMEAGHA